MTTTIAQSVLTLSRVSTYTLAGLASSCAIKIEGDGPDYNFADNSRLEWRNGAYEAVIGTIEEAMAMAEGDAA